MTELANLDTVRQIVSVIAKEKTGCDVLKKLMCFVREKIFHRLLRPSTVQVVEKLEI